MQQEILQLLQDKDYETLSVTLNKFTPEELSEFIKELSETDFTPVCRAIDSDLMADTLVLLDADLQEAVINALRDDELEKVFDEMSVEDTIEIIEDMPQDIVRRIAETEEIVKLLSAHSFSVLKPLVSSMNAIDLAKVFEEIENEADLIVLFRILPKDLASETFVEMDADLNQKLINKLNDKELRAFMDELFLDDTVDLIEEMPASVVKRLLAQSDNETRAYINEILKFPKYSAGSIMTIEFVAL